MDVPDKVGPPGGPANRAPAVAARVLAVRLRRALWPGLLWLLLHCDALDSQRQPHTPFGTVTDNEPAPAEPVPEPEQDRGPPAPVQVALGSDQDPFTLRVAGRTLEAPPGLAFRQAVAGPSAGGATSAVTAWLEGTADNPTLGELWHFPGAGAPHRLAVAPSFLPTGPTCSHSVALRASGTRSLTLDITARCRGPLLPRTAVRSFTVLSPSRGQPTLLSLRVAPAAVGERLDISLTSQDPDGDGRDDVQLRATLGTPVGQAELRLAWLDRSAGLSRDMRWPARSFEDLAAALAQSAKLPGATAKIAGAVAAARRLYGSLCAEGGVPRVFNSVGDGLACGPLGRQFEALSDAHISSALAAGDRLGALGALEQHEWFPSRGGSDDFTNRQAGRILKRVARRRVTQQRQLLATPLPPKSVPHLSPVRYADDGSLLVLTAGGTTRITPAGYEYESSLEEGPWPTQLGSARGQLLTGIAFPCERSEVLLLQSTSQGTPLPPLVTRLTAPRPGRCRDFAAWTPPAVTLLGWTESVPSGFVGASAIGPPLHPSARRLPGSPVSFDGHLLAVPTRWGILLLRNGETELWAVKRARRFHHCAPRHDGKAIACLAEGHVHVLELGQPTGG